MSGEQPDWLASGPIPHATSSYGNRGRPVRPLPHALRDKTTGSGKALFFVSSQQAVDLIYQGLELRGILFSLELRTQLAPTGWLLFLDMGHRNPSI